MPRKAPDPDFNIFVDPSCLSAPMDDETPVPGNINRESPAPGILEENEEQVWSAEDASAVEDGIVEESNMEEEDGPENFATEEGESIIMEEEQPTDELAAEADVDLTLEDADEVDEPGKSGLMSTGDHLEDDLGDEGEGEESELMPTEDHIVDEDEEIGDESMDHSLVDEIQEKQAGYHSDGEDEDTPRPTQIVDDDADENTSSRRESSVPQRQTSLRTEALIQATAREVVAKIEAEARARVTARYSDEHDTSVLSSTTRDSYGVDGTEMTYEDGDDHSEPSRRESGSSSGSQIHHHVAAHSVSGDSSSHPEPDDDDVFSDHSPRSSLGSADGGIDTNFKLPPESDMPSLPKIPRVSDISGISQYDKEEFIPMSRDTPRVPFRTPTAVRALQMSSPTPSVYSGGTPRSSKRHTGFVTISRLGSPTASAQYSPKGRSTPPRFKTKEAPLVLLHVTLMPLRWMWGDVLSGLDTINCGISDSHKRFDPSDELKTLRGAWRQLQDRIGDTVLERGILLPHPQNDYEVLEERLLEALELPLRRRARILECGHYLGPAEDDDVEEEESDDDTCGHSPRDRASEKRHWCNTCRGEIRYEDLGPGKMFRVKVYASNGLMKAGAWGACWKEMERVDIELEPVVETTLHAELERLAAVQAEVEEERQRGLDRDEERRERLLAEEHEHSIEGELPPVLPSSELSRADPRGRALSPTASSPPPPPATMHITMHASPPEPLNSSPIRAISRPATHHTPLIDLSDERRYRDEERLREIYGHTPPRTHPEVEETPLSPHTEHPSSAHPPHPDSYIPPPSPPSPSEEAFDRRSGRRTDDEHSQQHRRPYQTASLQELLLESARVLLRDRKNVAIVLLSFFVLMMATRPAHSPAALQQQPRDAVVANENVYRFAADPEHTVAAVVAEAEAAEVIRGMEDMIPDMEESAQSESDIPCASAVGQEAASLSKESVVTEPEVVRVRETITETVRVSVTMSEPESVKTDAALEPEALKLTVYETQTETVKVKASAIAELATEPEPELEIADTTQSVVAEPEVEADAETEVETVEATSSSPAESPESAATHSTETGTAIPVTDEDI